MFDLSSKAGTADNGRLPGSQTLTDCIGRLMPYGWDSAFLYVATA